MCERPEKIFHVYIMASGPRGVRYVGMTSDLTGRAWDAAKRVGSSEAQTQHKIPMTYLMVLGHR